MTCTSEPSHLEDRDGDGGQSMLEREEVAAAPLARRVRVEADAGEAAIWNGFPGAAAAA